MTDKLTAKEGLVEQLSAAREQDSVPDALSGVGSLAIIVQVGRDKVFDPPIRRSTNLRKQKTGQYIDTIFTKFNRMIYL